MSLKPSLKVTHLRKKCRFPRAAPFVAAQDFRFGIFRGELVSWSCQAMMARLVK